MYICKKHTKSSRIHIVHCLPEAFLSRIQCVYEQKILQIRAYTNLKKRKSGTQNFFFCGQKKATTKNAVAFLHCEQISLQQ
jgi:hypothetical protein